MASYSYSDDEDQKRKAQQDKLGAQPAPTGPTPTFAQLQQRGMPRPPPAIGALYGAAGQPPPPAYGGPQASLSGQFADIKQQAAAQPPPAAGTHPGSFQDRVMPGWRQPTDYTQGGAAAPPAPAKPATGGAPGYAPTNQLNQGNLEGYLYDQLANPTATPGYQNTMKRIGADIDTDASRRGVFYSTIPVGSYAQAGSDLAANTQQQAFGNLQNYNQNYEQLLMALLGQT